MLRSETEVIQGLLLPRHDGGITREGFVIDGFGDKEREPAQGLAPGGPRVSVCEMAGGFSNFTIRLEVVKIFTGQQIRWHENRYRARLIVELQGSHDGFLIRGGGKFEGGTKPVGMVG